MQRKYRDLTELLLVIILLVIINISVNRYFLRFDLTSEKRFTLSKASRELIQKLDDDITIRVYLEGEFPAGFKRLQRATQDLLEEYKAYGGTKIEYEFVDPFSSSSNRDEIIRTLIKKGLMPTQLQIRDDDAESQKTIVPGALIIYKGGREIPVNLMREQFGQDPEIVLNQSIENLEYEFSSAFRKCMLERKPKIGFTIGHGEVPDYKINSIGQALSENYEISRVSLNGTPFEELMKYQLLVIVKPDSSFSHYEKYKIDQYIMHGGKMMVFLENVVSDMDSISKYGQFLTPTLQTGLDELLFKYGVRVNYNLLADRNCLPVQLTELGVGGSKKLVLKPWSFYPVFTEHTSHPITKNLEPLMGKFSGTLDTVGNKNIQKSILLQSSEYSRSVSSPVLISFQRVIQQYSEPRYFNKAHQPVAVMLEGSFSSFYKNYLSDSLPGFKTESPNTKIMVAADADLIVNNVHPKTGEAFPLGFDAVTYQNTRTLFGNKKFILNCVDFMLDGSGLIDVRTREFKIRMLDNTKVKMQKARWQIINMVFPVIILLLFMGLNRWIRKKKYTGT